MALLKTNTGIGTTNPTSALHVIGDVLVTGVVTATTFNGNINAGVGTITTFTSTNSTITNLTNTRLTSGIGTINNVISNFNNTGVGTVNILNTGIGTINNLNSTILNVSGVGSIATLYSPTANINVGVITDLTNTRFTSGVSTITDLTNTRLTSGVGTITNLTGTNATLTRIDSTHINAGIVTANQLSTGASGVGININNNSITGPSSIVIDPAGVGDNTGAVRIKGDLYVDGDQFYVNSGTIELADLRVGIATTVGSNMLLDGGGIGIGSTNILKTFTYNYASDSLKSSENLDIAVGKTYKIDGTDVLSSNTLGSGVIYSSLQYLGTLNNLNVSGLSTLPTLVGTYATITEIDNVRFLSGISSITDLYASNGYINVGIVTNISGTNLNYTGVGTIATLNSTQTNLTNLNVSGISTLADIRAQRVTVTGIVTANSFRPTSGYIQAADGTNSFYIYNTTGNVSFQGTIGVNQINNGGGFQVITFNHIDTRLTGNLNVAGVTTSSVFNGNIYSLGVSTFRNGPVLIGTGSSTGTPSQRLQVADGVYISGNLGVGVTNPSSKLHIDGDELVTGVITATTFNGQINAGVSTLGISTAINLTTQQLIVSGLSTFVGVATFQNDVYINGDLYVTDDLVLDELTAHNINITGVGTIFNLISTAATIATFDSTTSTITDLSNTRLTSGIATITDLNVTNSTFNNLNTTNLNTVTGVVTTISGTNVTYTNSDFINLNADYGYIDVGIVTAITGTYLNYTGVGTVTTFDSDTASINNLSSDYINVGVATATILSSGIGTITDLNNTLLNVSGVATITTLNSTNLTSTNSDFTNLNADIANIDVGIVTDISGTNLTYTGVGTIATLDTTNGTIDYLTNTDLTVSGIATIQNLDVQGEFDVYDATATFHNDVFIAGNLSIGGTATAIIAQDLRVLDKEITLGITTDAFNNDVSNDVTANHGGISIASTVGYPLVDLTLAGFSSLPKTYKQLMWVAANSYGVGTTDAWMFNYAVGVGSTQVPNNVRLAVGNVQITDKQINADTLEVSRLTSGIATITGADIGNLHSNNIYSQTGVVTDISGTRLNYTGVGTITTFNSTNASITSLDLQRLTVAGISTFTNGPVLIGSGSQTGTFNQTLQVTGGAYISTYVGIGYTNPFSNLAIYDSNGSWISLVDPGQSSSAFENNNGTLYIRAEQGAGNSRIVFQTGTSNYEQRPSVSGSDRVEIDSLGNLLVNMGTPTGVSNQRLQVTGGAYVSGNTGIGISTPTSKLQVQGDVLVSGVVTATTFYGNFYGTGISTIGILDTQNLNVTGIITGGSFYIDGTQVISNSRELQNIVSLDSITTATIEAAIANAPNDFETLNVSGVSTFVNGPVQIGSGTSTGTASQRLQVTGGGYVSDNFGIGVTNPTSKLQVQGDVLVSGVVTATTFNGQINSGVATITTLSGTNVTYTNSDFTNLNADYGYIDVGIVTDLTNTRLTSGIATITTLNSTQSNLTNINSTGISTLNILQANTLQVSGIATFQDNVYLGINDVLNIGGANYLKLFHDGGSAYIDNDTGILYYNSGQHFFQNAAGTEVLASFTGDGGASLYFDNSKKLETVGTGVTVTGTLYAQNLSTGDSGVGININNNSITGPSSIVIDPAAVGDDTGAVRIKGDLYVDGTQFIVNSSTIELADLRVGIATTVGSNLLLDGGGIGIGSANILKTFTYNYSSDSLKSSENIDLASGKTYKINGVDVLSSTTLGSGVVNSSLTSVGTLTQLNVAGVGTIPTLNSTNANLKDILSERVTVSGIVTANSFRPSSGYIQAADGTNSFYIYNSTGNVAFQGNINVNQINNGGGYQVITFNNIDTRLTGNLDIAGVTTSSVFNGNVYSLGVSTFRNGPLLIGSGTSTGTLNQPLQVTGGGYISTNLGIGSTNPQYLLDVNGDINFNGLLYQNNQPFIASRWSAGTGSDIYRLSQVGIGTTNPEYNLDVLGDVRIRGGLYDNLNNSAGLLNYVVVADGFGGWSWQPVTSAGAGTLDGIEVRDQGNVVGTSGSITTLDFRSVETNNIVVTGYAGGSIATITLSDEPIFATLGVLKSSGLGIATANTLQVSGIATFTNGPVIIGSGSSTGTASQPLQVTGGAYVSGNLGIGTTNSQAKLQLNGTALITGAPTNDFTLANTAVIKKPSLVISSGVAYTHTGSYENISPLQIEATYSPSNIGSGYFYSQRFDTDLSPTASTGNYQYGLYNAVYRNNASDDYGFDTVFGVSNYYQQGNNLGSSAYTNKVYGLYNTLDNRKGNVNQYYGVYNFVQHGSDGSSPTNSSYSFGVYNDVRVGPNDIVDNLYGSYDSVSVSTGGTVTNYYGVYLDTLSTHNIINNWSIYSPNNASKMYHQGSIGIGTTNPQYKLDVYGDLNFNGTLYQNGIKFTSGIGIGSTSVNPISGVITPEARIGIGFTDINFVGTGLSITGYGSTVVIDFGNIAAGSGGAVSISTVSPGISTAAGNLWWDSTVGDLKIYYNDGNSAQWVDANGGSSVVTISESAPPGALNGDLWWDSTYGILKVYYDDGSSSQWVDANSGAYINYWIGTSAGIHTTGNVGVGTTIPTEKLQVDGYLSIDGNTSYGTATKITSSTSSVGIHSALPVASYRSVEYTIQATEGTNFHTTKILALHDGSTAYHTEYGTIFNNVGISTYDVDVSGGNIRLIATPASSSTTNFKITFNAIKV